MSLKRRALQHRIAKDSELFSLGIALKKRQLGERRDGEGR
jgi:hypothetical protein